MAKLMIRESGASGAPSEAVYELFEDTPEVHVGRGAANAVQIADGHASKTQFVLRRVRERWKLVDLESKNGTRVNGAFVNTAWLAHGDTVSVGATTLRFDAEGEASGPPPRRALAAVAAVPAPPPAARAAAAPVRPLAPAAPAPAVPAAARPAPVVVARGSVAAAAPAAASARPVAAAAPVAAAPAPVRPSARRRDEEAYDDEEGEERPRFQRKQGMSGGVLAVLLVLGVGLVALLINMLMSGSNPNSELREEVGKLRKTGRLQEALQAIEARAQAGEPGYAALMKERDELRSQVAREASEARNSEGERYFNENLSRRIAVGRLRPKGHVSDGEAAVLLRRFLAEFGDTRRAFSLVTGTDGTNAGYQQILRDNPDPSRTEASAWSEAEASVASMVNANRLGDAYSRLGLALAFERLNLQGEALKGFTARVESRQAELLTQARRLFQDALDEANALAKRGEKPMARGRLDAILGVLNWPDGEFARKADEARRSW